MTILELATWESIVQITFRNFNRFRIGRDDIPMVADGTDWFIWVVGFLKAEPDGWKIFNAGTSPRDVYYMRRKDIEALSEWAEFGLGGETIGKVLPPRPEEGKNYVNVQTLIGWEMIKFNFHIYLAD